MRPVLSVIALAALLGLASGCQPQIGDGCLTDAECDRNHTCDTTSPGGYCIDYDCEANECGPQAVCVEFEAEGEPLVTACMRSCQRDSDCRQRDGYVCRQANDTVSFCGIPPADEAP